MSDTTLIIVAVIVAAAWLAGFAAGWFARKDRE